VEVGCPRSLLHTPPPLPLLPCSGLPYDPVRPWVDTDGRWYATIAADSCNGTSTPCATGGRAYLFTSPRLRGPGANWTMVGPLFTSNFTVLTPYDPTAIESMELVTVDYIGNLTGDPAGGATRILCNNVFTANLGGTTAFFLGSQGGPGQPFVVDYAAPNATGMIDWGAFAPNGQGMGVAGLSATGNGAYKMARTLSSAPDQVAVAGRRVMTAWLDGGAAASQVRGGGDYGVGWGGRGAHGRLVAAGTWLGQPRGLSSARMLCKECGVIRVSSTLCRQRCERGRNGMLPLSRRV
jgi:hypothetical protein